MYKRTLARKLKEASKKYPVVSLIGPRQSGKTTLARSAFPRMPYVNLEKPTHLEFALEDPEGFLNQHPAGMIIDEAQRAPKLFSYIQTIVDEEQKAGMYVLTGSQNFGLMENITQSLAGRASIQTLLGMSLDELHAEHILPANMEGMLYTGGYPRIYDKALNATDWLGNYVTTYIERDVRSIKNVGDLSTFRRFLRMCAHRSGKILNLSSLADDCGINHNTAKAWVSILETSFIIFLLSPHHKNFNKRMIKSPKLYFYDTGLVSYLIGIKKQQELTNHSNIGAIFETYVISEMMKMRMNRGLPLNLYFWRDKLGREVDCIIEDGDTLTPVEIKAGRTISSHYFKDINYWCSLSKVDPSKSFVVYGGDDDSRRKNGTVLGWEHVSKLPL